MEKEKTIMDYDTVSLDDEDSAVVIIDQTLLPGRTELIRLKTAEEIWNAIYLLKVRGAPAIGVTAAFISLQKPAERKIMTDFLQNSEIIRNIWTLPVPRP